MAGCTHDIGRGGHLYEAHCQSCHREGLHDRANSRVATYSDLRFEVDRWAAQTGRKFTDAERAQLVAYLDANHYHLGQRSPRR